MIRYLSILGLFLLCSCASCPPATQQNLDVNLESCAAGIIPSALQSLLQQTVASLTKAPGAPTWSQWSEGPLLSQGENAAVCTVSAAVHSLAAQVPRAGEASPTVLDALDLAFAWLDQHHVAVRAPDHVKSAVAMRRAFKSSVQP